MHREFASELHSSWLVGKGVAIKVENGSFKTRFGVLMTFDVVFVKVLFHQGEGKAKASHKRQNGKFASICVKQGRHSGVRCFDGFKGGLGGLKRHAPRFGHILGLPKSNGNCQ